MEPFEQKIRVTAAHLDELQHVNNVQYLQWVQDIAGAHWQSLDCRKNRSLWPMGRSLPPHRIQAPSQAGR